MIDEYHSNYRIFMKFFFNIIIFIEMMNYNAHFLKVKYKDNLQNYSNDSQSFPFMKNKNDSSFKKLAIILPFNSEIHKKKLIYNTLNTIFNLNYNNYSLYLIYNQKRPKIYKKNIIFIKEIFNSLLVAFNLILDLINDNDYDYISFLTPGDLLNPSAYDFLYHIETHDIYQIPEINKTFFYQKHNKEQNFTYNTKIYDLIKRMPNNNYVIYDKIYKLSLLKKNKIKFILHEKSEYYFNLLSFSYAKDLLFINTYGILHNNQSSSPKIFNNKFHEAKIFNNKFQEAKIFKRIISANKSITATIIEEMNKIDYVFPYVTTNDSYWKHLYNISLSGKESQFSAGIQRFRDNGLLKYLFRSLEKNLPWINQVHMIVMCDSQVPDWINREKVHIIYHSDFIPKQYLPTFSSSLIETFLPLLPSVEEKFIYGNDDLLPCRLLSKKFFFYGNIPSYNLNLRDYSETAPGDYLRRNAYNIITGKEQNKRVATTQHSTISYRLSLLKNCFTKYKKTILNSLSKFREEKNFNQYIYAFYQMIEDTIINKPHFVGLFYLKPNNVDYILEKNFKKFDFICLNDEFEMTEKDWYRIQSKFESILPNKSKYEK